MRILIADDEVLSRRLLEKTLERAGYQVISVDNGRDAADQLSRPDAPRLALLDWIMPELDGLGVCREVRKRREHEYVYMVLISSRESKEDIVAGLESGADDYLTKPFDAEELSSVTSLSSSAAARTTSEGVTPSSRIDLPPAL